MNKNKEGVFFQDREIALFFLKIIIISDEKWSFMIWFNAKGKWINQYEFFETNLKDGASWNKSYAKCIVG